MSKLFRNTSSQSARVIFIKKIFISKPKKRINNNITNELILPILPSSEKKMFANRLQNLSGRKIKKRQNSSVENSISNNDVNNSKFMKDNSNNDFKEYQKQLNLSLLYTNKMWKKIASNNTHINVNKSSVNEENSFHNFKAIDYHERYKNNCISMKKIYISKKNKR